MAATNSTAKATDPDSGASAPPPSPLRELVQPFVDLAHAPRALWGINLPYMLEGMVYFGILGYLAIYFTDTVFAGVPHADEFSHTMVGFMTAGITLSMLLFGFVPDRFGVRRALIGAFIFMLAGRIFIASGPTLLGLEPAGLWSALHLVTLGGMLLIVLGYGMYMPAAYAGVRQFTNPKTAAMGFAMLYALMNLGGWLPTFAFLVRDEDFLGLGIPGTFWVYTSMTVLALVATVVLLSRRTVEQATAIAKQETEALQAEEAAGEGAAKAAADKAAAVAAADSGARRVPVHLWIFVALALGGVYFRFPGTTTLVVVVAVGLAWALLAGALPATARWLARHPLADGKFFFFIFALIPVQTLFTYNWLILPQYIERAFPGWIGEYFEIAANANPLLIFVLVPLIAAATQKANVYNMMIAGTFVMAAPAFLLVVGPQPWALFAYILIMTVGEAMWQPRFLQYAAEIAPPGRTGVYMGVAQLPWFLTKFLVPLLYSGWMMDRYCPPQGDKNTELMWLVFGCIAVTSPVLLIVAKRWVGRDFKTAA